MSEWTPSVKDKEARFRRLRKLEVERLISGTACLGCGLAGYLIATKVIGKVHYVRCRCGWCGKIIEQV